MSHMVNLVRVLTAATGNSTPITLGAAYSQLFMTPAEAGALDGRTYTWLYVDGNNWELVRGVYTASGTTAARTTVLASRINGTLGTTRITLTGTAQVRIVDAAEDKGGLRGTRPVTGTTDVIMNSDQEYVVTYSNASAIAASLAQAGTSGAFLDSWAVYVKNKGAGTLTITPATSTINGATTLVLATNQGAFIWSDGTNYQAFVFGDSAKFNVHGADIASASTVDMEAATGDIVDVTGTTTITAITLSDGHQRTVRFSGAATLTNGASLILPGAQNIVTRAGDFAVFRGYASGVVRCTAYTRADGSGVYKLTNTIVLSGSGTYSPTAGCLWFEIDLQAPGGGGAGSGSTGPAGTAGSSLTFGGLTLPGGGAANALTGGTAAAAPSGSITGLVIKSARGGTPGEDAVFGSVLHGGGGSPSRFGGRGRPGPLSNFGGVAVGPGSGGGGGGATFGNSGTSGGGGGADGASLQGIVVPASGATYSYVIPTAPAGGAAGTTGQAGGAGGPGYGCIIEHFTP